MPKRRNSTKPTTTAQHELATPLRRSPRFLNGNPQDPHSPKTTKNFRQKALKEPKKSDEKRLNCAIHVTGYRRSPRLSNGVEENSSIRRSSRLSSVKNSNAVVKKSGDGKSVNIEDSCSDKCKINNGSERKTENCANSAVVIGLEAVKRSNLFGKNQEIRVSKKRKRGEECNKNASVKGWTQHQEMALQRAYLVAKPTPNFWKQVSKLVPGKSAKDCFDRVHSAHITPPQPLRRSRAKKLNSSPLGHFSLSAGKLLSPSDLKIKRFSGNKLKSRVAQKTIRQLLQKHNHVDPNYEADLFSILEPNVNPSRLDSQPNEILSTPKRSQEQHGFLQKCHERSSSGQKKSLSRLGNLCGMDLVSPPVLKQVKNKALHEKYIDQLHSREAKRKKECAQSGKENSRQINIQKIDVVRAAKNALVFDARDAINKFQHVQTNVDDSSDADDDDCVVGDGDEYDGL